MGRKSESTYQHMQHITLRWFYCAMYNLQDTNLASILYCTLDLASSSQCIYIVKFCEGKIADEGLSFVYLILPTGAIPTAVPEQKTLSASINSSTGIDHSSTCIRLKSFREFWILRVDSYKLIIRKTYYKQVSVFKIIIQNHFVRLNFNKLGSWVFSF